jgi:energy-converting hydrogenase Eha subunit A
MIVFPLLAALTALVCALFLGLDALRRPRPDRVVWTIAFGVFTIAASAEVLGSVFGWNETLARVYYLCGAVMVVGVLALGELYLLLPGRVPAFAPGLALLVLAVAVTTVWSAAIDGGRLATDGWDAIERGPFLTALAVSINAGGTLVLVGGTLSSTWQVWRSRGSGRRAAGCLLIALGTVIVAMGGTLTRLGYREVLYLAMAVGIGVIFTGIMLTRSASAARPELAAPTRSEPVVAPSSRRARLIPLPTRPQWDRGVTGGEGILYVSSLLTLEDDAIAAACRRWSATPMAGDAFSRHQAHQVWALRCLLPEIDQDRYDSLPLATQAQLGELYADVWSRTPADVAGRGA